MYCSNSRKVIGPSGFWQTRNQLPLSSCCGGYLHTTYYILHTHGHILLNPENPSQSPRVPEFPLLLLLSLRCSACAALRCGLMGGRPLLTLHLSCEQKVVHESTCLSVMMHKKDIISPWDLATKRVHMDVAAEGLTRGCLGGERGLPYPPRNPRSLQRKGGRNKSSQPSSPHLFSTHSRFLQILTKNQHQDRIVPSFLPLTWPSAKTKAPCPCPS